MGSSKGLIARWVQILRAPFYQAAYIPVGVGAAVAWFTGGVFDPSLFVLALVGVILLDSANHMFNDYFDYRSGNDLRVSHVNPFAGGGRALTTGLISPGAHFKISFGFLAAGILVGVYLVATVGLVLLLIGVIGVLSLYFYVGPPFKLAYRGVGEVFVGLNYGPLIVLGSYYVQAKTLSLEPALASVPVALLVTAILWINEFPDYEADVAVGKRTLMARLGHQASIRVFTALMATPYLSVAASVALGLMPPLALWALLTLPLALKSVTHLKRHYREPNALIPANAAVVMTHLFTGLLLIAAYAVWPLLPA